MGGTISEDEVDRWLEEHRSEEAAAINERIRQLERLNATLAAELDRMRPIVEEVQRVTKAGMLPDALASVGQAVRAYEAAREGGDGLSPTR